MSKPPHDTQLVIVDRDLELTIAMLDNVMICHWVGPHDLRNGRRVDKAMHDAARQGPFGVVAIVEPGSAPPDTTERARISAAVRDLPIAAVATLVRGSAVRRNLMTMVFTAMLFLLRSDFANKLSFCADEQEAARWVTGHLSRHPGVDAVVSALVSLAGSA